jgi:hypothetical protein
MFLGFRSFVQLETLDDVMSRVFGRAAIDLLKLDVQAAEFEMAGRLCSVAARWSLWRCPSYD